MFLPYQNQIPRDKNKQQATPNITEFRSSRHPILLILKKDTRQLETDRSRPKGLRKQTVQAPKQMTPGAKEPPLHA